MVNNTALDLIISWVSAPIVWLTRFSFVVCVSRVLPVNTVTVTNRCKRGVSLTMTALYQRLSPCRHSSTGQLCLSVRWRIQLRLRQQILWLWQTDVSLESAWRRLHYIRGCPPVGRVRPANFALVLDGEYGYGYDSRYYLGWKIAIADLSAQQRCGL